MGKGQILAIFGAVALVVMVYFASRTPSESVLDTAKTEAAPAPESEATETLTVDQKVAKAVEIIEGGTEPPMQAVVLLREAIAEDSNNVAANYWLGEFSVMSGQHEKAIGRYKKVLQLQPDNTDVCAKLAMAYKNAGKPEEGIAVIETFLSTHPQKEITEQLTSVLNELKN